jgi:hypothetical protein
VNPRAAARRGGVSPISYEALMDQRRDQEVARSTAEQAIHQMVGKYLWESHGIDPDRLTVTVEPDLSTTILILKETKKP